MIVVDTSALIAIVFNEPDAQQYLDALANADRVVIAAPSVLELRTVLCRKLGRDHMFDADALLALPSLEIADWTADDLGFATDALRRFGGRPASLNFGDCIVYALAKRLDAPLLYKGEDFARTDIRPAL
jgi:ribonuclease VapC